MNEPRREPGRRKLATRIFVVVLLSLALVSLFAGSWDNPGPDLRGFTPADADVSVHLSNSADAWRAKDGWFADVKASDGLARAWPAVFAASTDQVAAILAALRAADPRESVGAKWLHGELLVAAAFSDETAIVAAGLWGEDSRLPFPFRDLTAILRPTDRRAALAVRAALDPWVFDRFIAPRLPAGSFLEDGVIVVPDVSALVGSHMFRDRRPPPLVAMSCVRDRIVVGTDVARVRTLAGSTPNANAAPARAATLRLSAKARARLGSWMEENVTAGVPAALRTVMGLSTENDIGLALNDWTGDAVVRGHWPSAGLPLTRSAVAATSGITLIAADGGTLARGVLSAMTGRHWLTAAARSTLTGASGPLALSLRISPRDAAFIELDPLPIDSEAEPAFLRVAGDGASIAGCLEESDDIRVARATTPPDELTAAAREDIADDLARATAENELDPSVFEEIVAARHALWTAEWERKGLDSRGLALGEALKALCEVTGAIEVEVGAANGVAAMSATLRARR